MKEQQIQNQIIAFIRAIGGWCQRINSGCITTKDHNGRQRYIKMADKGTPDVLACVKGVFVAIEVKKDERAYLNWQKQKTDTDVAQHMQMRWIREAGGIHLVAYSVEHVEEDLKSYNLI